MGISFLTLGIRIIDISSLGLAFSDAIVIKLTEIFNINASISSLILGSCILIVVSIIKKSRPQIECLITSFALGFFIDFWMFFIKDVSIENIFVKIGIFIFGAFVLSLGVSMYLQPQYPSHPIDLLLITLVKTFNFSMFKSKVFMDVVFAMFAIFLVAPIGIGSIFNTLCLGFFIDKIFFVVEKFYKRNSK